MMLHLQENIVEDNTIFSCEDFPFNPISGTQYNAAGVIQINIENQAEYFLPHQSWLQIDGQLLKADGTRYDVNDNATLTNNGILYCFSNIKYQLSGNEIESLNDPGHASTIMGLLKYETTYPGLNQCWAMDKTTGTGNGNTGFHKRKAFISSSNPIGSFSFAIDLQHIFGFAEDYDKVVYGLRHTLQFNRKPSDNNAIFRAGAPVAAGKVQIDKITWWVPRVTPSPVESFRLTKMLEKNATLQVGFRGRQCAMLTIPAVTSYTWNLGVKTEKPRFLIIGFQTGKDDNQETNAALFDHRNITKLKVILNSAEYPAIDILSNFTRNEYAGYYKRMADFKRLFYGIEKSVSSCSIDADAYKSMYPLYVLDVSHQVEKLKSSIVDVSVKMDFGEAVPQATNAFALIISDKKLQFKSDGKNMSVVF